MIALIYWDEYHWIRLTQHSWCAVSPFIILRYLFYKNGSKPFLYFYEQFYCRLKLISSAHVVPFVSISTKLCAQSVMGAAVCFWSTFRAFVYFLFLLTAINLCYKSRSTCKILFWLDKQQVHVSDIKCACRQESDLSIN